MFSFMQWNMTPDGWNRYLRSGGAVQDLVQLTDEAELSKEWGEELGGRIKELLRRRARAPRWGFDDAEGDFGEQRAGDDGAAAAMDNEVQMGQEHLEELERERQDALDASRNVSNPLGSAAKSRDGSLQRNSLQPEDVQVGDATGHDQVGVDVLGGGQDLLQTGELFNLDITPERNPPTRVGGLAQAVSPVQPEALVVGNEVPIGQEHPLQDQSLNHGGAQGGEEAQVTEFSLLVGGHVFWY